jgi:DNA modification methylase
MNFIEFGDCRETMRGWKAEGITAQMCVTSPPYFGLRDYGHEGQIGLEQTPEEYIAAMVEVFRCVRDVLADDGTLWLNIGDSYCGYKGDKYGDTKGNLVARTPTANGARLTVGTPQTSGVKNKDLIGIPWMLAFALRADGWYLRQDIIWHKPNPMPESVRDRCTKAHEYIFLLSKSDRYFFDSEAMKEPSTWGRENNPEWQHARAATNAKKHKSNRNGKSAGFANWSPDQGRNKRSVWTVATRPYKGAHFATFPPALIEPCILAGSRPGDVVLDPFMGSGTTAAVAKQHGRQYIGCELNEDYWPLQEERIRAVA